jgi:hypothetical protein
MANGGWYGTDEEWQRLEGPLLGIDPVLEQFALEHGVAVTKNHKDSPGTIDKLGNQSQLPHPDLLGGQ